MFSQERFQADRLIRLVVTPKGQGWETREECDDAVVRITHHTDWHRVERCILRFERDGVTPEPEPV
jgi:hypothetical protein